MRDSLAIIIPTFNEPELLEQTIRSLDIPANVEATIFVANAGDDLPVQFSALVSEIKVDSKLWWTGQMQAGMDEAKKTSPKWVLFLNADTSMVPGSISKLIEFGENHPNTIACCPAYEKQPDGSLKLIYSHQLDWGFLLYGKLVMPWRTFADSPKEPFLVDLTGGQGTLFPGEVLNKYKMDPENCPHYGGDHDFWLTLREGGIRLWLVPQAGIINDRQFGGMLNTSLSKKLKGLWIRMSNRLYPESAGLMWRFRKKHLPLPIAVISFICAFGIRWTLGLPKMLKRL